MLWAWLAYPAASAVILYSGFRLCRAVDALAPAWGWTRSWAGLVLLATVTSLPELFTGFSSIALADTPRIALGDVAGSLAFNLLLLGLLALVARRRLFQVASPSHATAIQYAAVLTALATFLALAAPRLQAPWLGVVLLLFPILYGVAMWNLHRRGLSPTPETVTRRSGLAEVVLHAALIVAAAMALPYAGAAIADATGLSRTFVGGLLIAASTSLPEMAVTLAAWRMGAPDLAMGNLIGSNLFNLAILGFDEAFDSSPLLAFIETGHVALLAASLLMTGLAWIGLRAPTRVSGRLVGAAIVTLYIAAQVVGLA